jgi:DNA-binding NarL/FixJ family response regulator
VARPAASQGRKQAGVPRTILLVDDSAMIRKLLRTWVEQHGDWMVCGEAENGKIAVQKVQELRPDIVLLDLQMPVMNGIEAARQIQKIAPNTGMVMFTMHSSKQLFSEAKAVGVSDVISKGDLRPALLLDALGRAGA